MELTIDQLHERLVKVETIVQSAINTTDEKRMITVKELSRKILISEKYIYKLRAQQKIPFHRPTGGCILFDINEIEEWLHSTPMLKRIENRTPDKSESKDKKKRKR